MLNSLSMVSAKIDMEFTETMGIKITLRSISVLQQPFNKQNNLKIDLLVPILKK